MLNSAVLIVVVIARIRINSPIGSGLDSIIMEEEIVSVINISDKVNIIL